MVERKRRRINNDKTIGVFELKRSKRVINYHGRTGKPVIHTAKSGKNYIMVRKKGGGVKRLYQGSKYTTGKGRKVRLKV